MIANSKSCTCTANELKIKEGTGLTFPFLDIYFKFSDIRVSAKFKAKIDLGSESFISETLFSTLFPGKEIPEKIRLKFFLFDERRILNYISLRFSIGNKAQKGFHLLLGGNGLSKFSLSGKHLILKSELTKVPIYWNSSGFCQSIYWQKLERNSIDEIFALTSPDKRPDLKEGQNLSNKKGSIGEKSLFQLQKK